MFPQVDLPADIPGMGLLAQGMMRAALRAFIEVDGDLAQSGSSKDDSMDRLNKSAYFALSSLIGTQPELVPQAMNMHDDRPRSLARCRPFKKYRRRRDFLGARRGRRGTICSTRATAGQASGLSRERIFALSNLISDNLERRSFVCNRWSERESGWPWMIANNIHVWSRFTQD